MLSMLATPDTPESLSETIDIMLETLDTQYLPATARKIAMLLRRLPQRQTKLVSESELQNILPFFCLGMVSHYHDQTRKDVCNVLAQMVEDASIEESVVNIVIKWLQTPSEENHVAQETEDQTNLQRA